MTKSGTVPGLALMICAVSAGAAVAQTSSGSGNAGVMWGTSAMGSVGSGVDSGLRHATDGVAASQTNAARNGMLYPANIAIYAIGVQNNTSVTGNNNVTNTQQTGTNTGAVSNIGGVGAGR